MKYRGAGFQVSVANPTPTSFIPHLPPPKAPSKKLPKDPEKKDKKKKKKDKKLPKDPPQHQKSQSAKHYARAQSMRVGAHGRSMSVAPADGKKQTDSMMMSPSIRGLFDQLRPENEEQAKMLEQLKAAWKMEQEKMDLLKQGLTMLPPTPPTPPVKKETPKFDLNDLSGNEAELLRRMRNMERQLKQAGMQVAEVIDYAIAKKKVDDIAKRMQAIGGSEVVLEDKAKEVALRREYFSLEQDMEKYTAAMMLTDEYIEEQRKIEQKWLDDNEPKFVDSVKRVRRMMPVEVKIMSEAMLIKAGVPQDYARKFKRSNILEVVRMHPDQLLKMHPSLLEGLRQTGLTMVERRAIHYSLRKVASIWEKGQGEELVARKYNWFKALKDTVKQLSSCGEMAAEKKFPYDQNLGFPEGDEYYYVKIQKADAEDAGAKAKREAAEMAKTKKAELRAGILKDHYGKGKVQQVSLASGQCEEMDNMVEKMDHLMDEWVSFLDKHKDLTADNAKVECVAYNEFLNTVKSWLSGMIGPWSGMNLKGKRVSLDGSISPHLTSPSKLCCLAIPSMHFEDRAYVVLFADGFSFSS